MKPNYMELNVNDIQLDLQNPRISQLLEIYPEETLTGEAIALALGGGADNKNGTSYSSLKESIKVNKGIIHPIIVNKTSESKYIVIEGNTRVQIYKEFIEKGMSGRWDKIRSFVYDDLSDEQIHAIRLQSHLVGPRDWDAYSKAKYLNYLSNSEKLPLNQIVAYCGGKSKEVKKFIDAYDDMEKYYRKNLENDSDFDPRDFSKFVELQNKSVLNAIKISRFTKEDYAEWVINGNIDTAQNVRKLPNILKNEKARKEFLKSNITEASKTLTVDEFDSTVLKDVSYDVLAEELAIRLKNITHQEVRSLRTDIRYDIKKNKLLDAFDELDLIIKDITGE